VKVIHLTSSVSRIAGGLYESVRNLSTGVAAVAPNTTVEIIGAQDNYTSRDIDFWYPLAVRAHKIWGPRRFAYSRGMTADLLASQPDLVHLHGVWQYSSLALLRWARSTKKPYVVSPHGMMEPWSLKQGRFKKGLASRLYNARCLRNAHCIRATSTLEA
jgi:hypothetical protein